MFVSLLLVKMISVFSIRLLCQRGSSILVQLFQIAETMGLPGLE